MHLDCVSASLKRAKERGAVAGGIELLALSIDLLEWAHTALGAIVNMGDLWTPWGSPMVDMSEIEDIQSALDAVARRIEAFDIEGQHEDFLERNPATI